MPLFQAFILSLVQGITEFLPISSSGHLVITRDILHWPDAGAAFDAFAGLGTLTAVCIYFRTDIALILKHWFLQFTPAKKHDTLGYARLGNYILIATFPTLIVGYLIKDKVDVWFHSPMLIASTTLVYGILLGAADYYGSKILPLAASTKRTALIYGLAQVLSLVPGTSRSGITITAGLAMGFTRQAAARFSFLMSIPISAAAGGYGLLKIIKNHETFNWQILGLSYAVSLISALLCIAIFLKFLSRIGMWPHVIYRLILGIVLLYLFL